VRVAEVSTSWQRIEYLAVSSRLQSSIVIVYSQSSLTIEYRGDSVGDSSTPFLNHVTVLFGFDSLHDSVALPCSGALTSFSGSNSSNGRSAATKTQDILLFSLLISRSRMLGLYAIMLSICLSVCDILLLFITMPITQHTNIKTQK